VTPKLNQFYSKSGPAIISYIDEMNNAIEARKFFGKGNKKEGYNNLENSIGSYVADLVIKGKITPSQEIELRAILNARFNPKGTGSIVGLYKNLTYIDVMGSSYNAITQIGDFAYPLYVGGIKDTIKGTFNPILKKEDLGIDRIAVEFSDAGKVAKAVDEVFQLTGLDKIDRLGKESLITVAIIKYQKLAKNPNVEFVKKMNDIFGNESESVIKDLKDGIISENVKLLAFNELLDFQPLGLSEMPEKYLTGGNGRILYMLKTYTIKMFDNFRRESFAEINKGNYKKGFGNLLKLASLLIICNGTADEIKDFILGRKTKLSDRVVDQIAMLAGFSRYTLRRISEQGLGKAVKEQIFPPTNFVDNLSKDLINLYKDFDKSASINEMRTVQDIPLVGKFYYWWFGKGRQLPELPAPKEKTKLEIIEEKNKKKIEDIEKKYGVQKYKDKIKEIEDRYKP
jgi:hypothetical protein